jgi:glycosyltransferase involved in cell wall biosynthesis
MRVAVVQWGPHDGLTEALGRELVEQGHAVTPFLYDQPLPEAAEVVLTFAPYGPFLPIAQQVGRLPAARRPLLVHWSTEGFPDPRLPWAAIAGLGTARSWLGTQAASPSASRRRLAALRPVAWLNRRFFRFRYVGDTLHAWRRGWLSVYAEVSEMYAGIYRRHGLPAQFVPWGTSPLWHADLKLERDIDVLWMGKRRNGRRSGLLDRVRARLEPHGVKMYVADGVERPFIFGDERTRLLNRAKITLNVKTKWYNSGFTFRFHMVAGNRSLVVSEQFMPHVSRYQPGVHFAVAPPERLAETILYYLEHEDERRALAENAYQLATTELTLGNSVRALMRLAAETSER